MKAYPGWVKARKALDKCAEDMVMSVSGQLKVDMIQGGSPTYAQERLLEWKEGNKYYKQLSLDIHKIDRVIGDLTDERKFLVEAFYWRGREWWELCKVLDVSKTTLYLWIDSIDAMVFREWEGTEVMNDD